MMIKNLNLTAIARDGSTLKKSSADPEEVKPRLKDLSLCWLEYVVDDIASGAAEVTRDLGLTLNSSTVLGGYYSNYEDSGEVLGVTIPLIKFASGKVDPSPVLFFLTRDRVVTIHDESVQRILGVSAFGEGYLKKLPLGQEHWADRQTILFARIIDEISERNYDTLRLIVEQAQTLEIELTGTKKMTKDVGIETSRMKRSVLTFLTAVWATHTTVHSLRYGDADMLADKPEVLSRFDLILADIDRQIQLGEHVLEVLAAGMNVIQTEVTNRLSIIILWLSVIGTALLVPNTLATIFAIFPESASTFDQLMVAILLSTALASVVSYLAARRILGSGRLRSTPGDEDEGKR